MRHFETKLGKKCDCLTLASMLGIMTKSPTMLWAGRHEIPRSVTFWNTARHNPTTLTPWGCLWIKWQSARSLTAYGYPLGIIIGGALVPPQYGPKDSGPITVVASPTPKRLVIRVCKPGSEVPLAGLVDFLIALAPHSISSS